MTLSFHGIPAAPGKGLGHIVVYRTAQLTQSTAQTLPTRPPAEEWQHFLTIQAQVDQEIYAISQTANSVVADIFSSQRAILNDPTLIEPIHIAIESNRISAVEAVQKTVDKLVWQFRLMQDEYFASRATDLLDIGTRLLERLEGEKESAHVELSRASILIAEELVDGLLFPLLDELL